MNKHLKGARSLDLTQLARQVEVSLSKHLGPSSAPWQATLVSSQASHGGTLVFSGLSTQTCRKVAAKIYHRRHLAEAELRAAREAQLGKVAIAPVLFAEPQTGLIVSDWQEGKSVSDLLEGNDWEDAVAKAGGIFIEARSVDQVVDTLRLEGLA